MKHNLYSLKGVKVNWHRREESTWILEKGNLEKNHSCRVLKCRNHDRCSMIVEHQANKKTSNAELHRSPWLVENEIVEALTPSVYHNWSDNCRRKRALKLVSHAISIMKLALNKDFIYQTRTICKGRRLTEKDRETKTKVNKFQWNVKPPFEPRTILFFSDENNFCLHQLHNTQKNTWLACNQYNVPRLMNTTFPKTHKIGVSGL